MKPQSNKPQLIASIHCDESDRAYRVTEITFWSVGPSRYSTERLFKCRWQSSANHAGWYGSSVTIDLDSGKLDELPRVAKFFAKHPLTDSPNEWLASTGVPIRVFDLRSDTWVEPARLLPANYRRWMARGSDGCCSCSVVATEEHAEREMMLEFARNLAGGEWYRDNFEFWMQNGKKVEADPRNVMPVVPDLDRAFSSLGDEHRARVEAEQERILELQEAEAEAERLANAVPSVFDAVM